MKKFALLCWLVTLALIIGSIFWYNDWKYSLPTPVPADYKAVSLNTEIELPASIQITGKKPQFLHFFNPSCPCSRFNMPHFASLVKEYSDKVDFTIVVLSNNQYTVSEIQKKFGVDVPVLFNKDIAVTCGVYSTPQAVIIDNDHKLFYRGNYNKTRYCTNKETEYARMAVEALIHRNYSIAFSPLALKAYGCQMPDCKK